MVAVLLVKEADLAIGRRDADEHPPRGHQRRQHRAIHFDVRGGARLVPPERDLVEHDGEQRLAANVAEAVAVNGDHDAGPESYLAGRGALDLLPKDGASLHEPEGVLEHDLSLIAGRGEHEHVADLAGRQPVLREARLMHRDGGGRSALASSPTDDAPQLAHSLGRWRAAPATAAKVMRSSSPSRRP